jgi:hypothetical protein
LGLTDEGSANALKSKTYFNTLNRGALCQDPAPKRISVSITQRNAENAAERKKKPCIGCLIKQLFTPCSA